MTVRIGDTVSIMMSTPMTVSRLVSSCDSVCCRLCDTLSMSLVTRLRSSPRGCLSKYDSGRRSSFVATSRRISYTVFCTTPLRIQPLPHERTAPIAYRPTASMSHMARSPKTIPWPGVTCIRASMSARFAWPVARSCAMIVSTGTPTGRFLPTTPVKMTSVALPRTFGPRTVKVTPMAAIRMTIETATFCGPR